MINNLVIKVNSNSDSDVLINLEGESAFTKYELECVSREDVQDENKGLDLSTFSTLAFEKHINQTLPLFGEYNGEEFNIECEIWSENISPIFNELVGVFNDDSEDYGVKISSLNNAQKDVIREYLETINKITYKGVKLANLDIDYIIECGKITVIPNEIKE